MDANRNEGTGAGGDAPRGGPPDENATEVTQPWHAHGPVTTIGIYTYFQGNARNPNDMCGNDSLFMKMQSMTPAGTCPSDGIVSYYLIPDPD